MSTTCARASVHAPRANPARRGVSARRAVRSRARVATAAAATTTDRDVAVVTGGAKGIGAACCELLAEQGWAVVVNHRASSADAAAALVEKIRASGGHALAHEADVGVEADVVAMFDAAAAYGTVKGLVNNAGILMGAKGSKSVADADADDLEQIMRVNLVGPVLCCREAVRVMSRKKAPGGAAAPGEGGAIVNVSSGSAVIGRPLLYAASKGALNSFQAGAVDELAAHGIRINAVSPGMTDTELVADVVPTFDFSKIPLGRIGAPSEIAEGVCFLLGERSSYVSGANLRIAGGRAPGNFLG
jgi:NAD(P)-dependent dehydrogenase (short-subunit alcohol dehydrogenase family)